MKIRLHTKLKPLTLILTDGSTFSTYFRRAVLSRNQQWALSLDTQSHPFWQRKENWDQNFLNMSSQRTRFQKKYDLSNMKTNASTLKRPKTKVY